MKKLILLLSVVFFASCFGNQAKKIERRHKHNLRIVGNGQCEVYNVLGRQVFNGNVSDSLTIQVAKGNYLVKLDGRTRRARTR